MRRYPIIGVTGLARAGKDTVTDFLLAMRGGYRYSFAQPIKAMLAAIGVDLRDPYWADKKEDIIPALGASPRRLMQTLGTEWGRDLIHPDLWLTLAKGELVRSGAGMIVSDVRFENEAAWVRQLNGKMIHVIRSAVIPVEQHVSENGVAIHPTDIQLFNNGTLEDLHGCVRELVRVYDET